MIILAICYWNGKTAPSVFLHKQLDVTPWGGKLGKLGKQSFPIEG
jgi:hypothetical protein